MKTILSLFILFSVTFGLQQAQAQSGKSYEEWRKASVAKSKSGKPAKSTTAKAGKKTAAAMAAPAGIFVGTIPCADCEGINTELVLNGAADGASRTFTMKQTYLGKPAGKNVVTASGKWFLAKGNKQDPDAVVLQLIPKEKNMELMYFRQVSDTEVKLLDRQQAEIQSKQNYSLKKQ